MFKNVHPTFGAEELQQKSMNKKEAKKEKNKDWKKKLS